MTLPADGTDSSKRVSGAAAKSLVQVWVGVRAKVAFVCFCCSREAAEAAERQAEEEDKVVQRTNPKASRAWAAGGEKRVSACGGVPGENPLTVCCLWHENEH
jgi:hypothetical protein